MTTYAHTLAAELRIYLKQHNDSCCLAPVLEDGDANAGRLLGVRNEAKKRDHVLCVAMVKQLLSVLPDDRALALKWAQGGDDANA